MTNMWTITMGVFKDEKSLTPIEHILLQVWTTKGYGHNIFTINFQCKMNAEYTHVHFRWGLKHIHVSTREHVSKMN